MIIDFFFEEGGGGGGWWGGGCGKVVYKVFQGRKYKMNLHSQFLTAH